MRIYVAGSSAECVRVRRVQDAARQLGHEITVDWTASVERGEAPSARHAIDDLRGVVSADMVIALSPAAPLKSEGAAFELGAAVVAHVAHIWVSGPTTNVFALLPVVRGFADDDAAITALGRFVPTDARQPLRCG